MPDGPSELKHLISGVRVDSDVLRELVGMGRYETTPPEKRELLLLGILQEVASDRRELARRFVKLAQAGRLAVAGTLGPLEGQVAVHLAPSGGSSVPEIAARAGRPTDKVSEEIDALVELGVARPITEGDGPARHVLVDAVEVEGSSE